MRLLIYIIIQFAVFVLWSQDIKNPDSLKHEVPAELYWGVFSEAAIDYSPGIKSRTFLTEFNVGIQLKSYYLGLGLHQSTGVYQEIIIFPSVFSLEYQYAGLFVGKSIPLHKLLELDLRFYAGHGDMVWRRESNQRVFARDTYQVYQPGLLLVFKPIEAIKIFGQIGYKWFRGLDLSYVEGNLTSEDFSGITLSLGIRLGLYKNQ